MTQLIGQRGAETILARGILAGRSAHAYLFLGPSGAGKSTTATLFAQALNCERQPAAEEADGTCRLQPCGRCDSCRRIASGTHPEVLEVRPDTKTGQNISVNAAREIRKNAALRPKLGRRRVYLIPNAETFNEESANALLKTLEEPSEFVTLILCAPNPSQVLPTIRSRCQTVRFGLAPPVEIAAALEQGGVEAELARSLAHACGGRPGLALTWSKDPSSLEQRKSVLDLFARALAAAGKAGRDPALGILSLRLAERLRNLVDKSKSTDDGPARPAKALHSDNLETALTYLRDLLLLTEGADSELVQNQDRLAELHEVAGALDGARAVDAIHTIREAQQLLDRNVAPQLVMERMFWALIAGPIPVRDRLFDTVVG